MQYSVPVTVMRTLKARKAIERRRYLRFMINDIVSPTFSTLGRHQGHETEINAGSKS